jgi:iron complex outermembrane recepter protein
MTKLKDGAWGVLMFLAFQMFGSELHAQSLKDTVTTAGGSKEIVKESPLLEEVVVIGERRNQFAQKQTEYTSKMPLKNLDNAQTYSIVSGTLMQEQMATDIVSSLKSITGGGSVQSNDGNATVYIRGFRADASIRNGLTAYTRTPVDPVNLERMEIIKGPSATLYGGTSSNIVSYGGLINRVTKKPKENRFIDLSYTTGSFNLNRITLDYNSPLHILDGKTVLFRLNSAFHTENSFQNQGLQKNFTLAPSLKSQLNSAMTLTVEAEYYQTKRNLFFARGINANKVTANNFGELNLDYLQSYTSNDMAADMQSLNYSMVLDSRISSHWTSKTSFASTKNTTQGQYFRLEMVNDSMAARNFIGFMPRNVGSWHVQQDFLAHYNYSGFENSLLIGASYAALYDDYQRYSNGFVNYDTINLNKTSVPSIAYSTLEKKLTTLTSIQTETSQHTSGIYVSDVLKLPYGLVVSAGLRYDVFNLESTIRNGVSADDGYDQAAWSPKIGLVYNYKDKISIFANYQNGFTNVAPGTTSAGDAVNYKPIQANQSEVGLKIDLYEGKIIGTLSYYDINLKNILRQNPTNTTEMLQDGEQFSRGFEIDLIANPFPGFNFVAGYTLNKSEFVNVTDTSIVGHRPSYTPEQMANFWASYRTIRGKLRGLGAGLGMNHVSKIYINDANSFWSPQYTVWDATLFYDRSNYRFSIKIDNLFNHHYWNAYGIPQKERSILAGITLRL